LALPFYTADQFAHPVDECDVIMKGGITSGVVYPLAICELARRYRLRNIGGTSAGAIAAVLAAAAELGRFNPDGGFTQLAELPGFLQKNLLSLFQPSRATRPAFEVLLAWLGPAGISVKLARTMVKLLRFHGLAALLGAAFGLVLYYLLAILPAAALGPGAAIGAALFAMTWGALAAAVAFVLRAARAIPENCYGICSGMGSGGSPALTPWLAERLDRIAGKSGGPLTFGDLWGAAGADGAGERRINLEVMTTNLTHGAPQRLPFATREFFYDPGELRRFFPGEIVEWMQAHPATPNGKEDEDLFERIRGTGKLPFPDAVDLPVVVAARMSLSFPVLFSAIPLHTIDWTLKANQEAKAEGRAPRLERCWFSDGGIGSNFPVHFFDQLLPGRPTFGINLRPFHPDYPKDPRDESHNVWFPITAGAGILPVSTAIAGLPSFLKTILDTMQNWVDNTQMRLPGYRDRVIHVHLTPDEGGMNLTMPDDRVTALALRGQAAGQKLATQFDWDGHRWTRYLVAMSQLEEKLEKAERLYRQGFADFLAGRDPRTKPYPQSAAWKDFARRTTAELMSLVARWRDEKQSFGDNPPHPQPDLRVSPRR
jgi:predicted acylesterase/phospholipase RssA